MASRVLPRGSNRVILLLYLVITALVVAIVYFLQWQMGSTESRVVESGLIESGGRPAVYFSLRNTGQDYANYTYVVTYNSTGGGMVVYKDTVRIPPGRSFSYTVSFVRPTGGVMAVNLIIFKHLDGKDWVLLCNETWFIRPQG
jgi:hypothetical protein